ncbi:UNVERIFIED_CONTAM: hypothetical protein Sradi_0685300 [Sesamum radiatum]|uniref:Uncharacterized protein n=1 Tax=Sesamum radiatum TaxID=300843 RepID=A0AAW2VMZ9_SESRA
MITSVIRKQLTVFAPVQVITQPEVVVPDHADPTLAIPRLEAAQGPAKQLSAQAEDVPPEWLAQLEALQKGLQDAEASKREGRGEKRKENKEKTLETAGSA